MSGGADPQESNHPDYEILEKFASGLLSVEDSERVEKHLASCEVCGEQLGQFELTKDSLVGKLRNMSNPKLQINSANEGVVVSPDEFEVDNRTARLHQQNIIPAILPDQQAQEFVHEHFGRYNVVKLIGQGGFGKVYQGYDEQLKRTVAIKVTLRQFVEPDSQLFLVEAQILASLDHACIVPVYDIGQAENGDYYIVSKMIDGGDLAGRIRADRPTRLESLSIVSSIANALHHAHSKGLVHRDVKPANILMDSLGRAYLTDFGIALREQQFGSGSGIAGTPAFMSPEQARGEGHRIDGRSDIYSLGVVLYELLTGRRPFLSDNALDLMMLIAENEVKPPRQFDMTIHSELERIVLRALALRASDRYSTAADLAQDLQSFAASVVPSQRPETAKLSEIQVSAMATSPPTPTGPTRVIPKGLHSFDKNDTDFFLDLLPGPRDRSGLPDSIRFWKSRIEARDPEDSFSVGLVYGPSGCGKSSLMKAGLLPRLSANTIPIYIEASSDDTEMRLLKGIQKRFPALAGDRTLKDTLAAIRRGQGLGRGQKLLLVIDQFEQWLHGKGDYRNTQLTSALRQCDGVQIQCIVMVRDDFWLSVSRFMRELEILIVEGTNSGLVDLFDLDHAAKVLGLFGRAFGKLSDSSTQWTKDQNEFVRQAIDGLAQDRKVISVRIALFAEMMKSRAWVTASLREVGGTQGIGSTFLESTFSLTTAPPQHRFHQKAARALLAALLPKSGSDIKGHMRSWAYLLVASDYTHRLQDFDELMRILDSELRLITPVDVVGGEHGSGVVEAHYQLTHDYLVPSLRDWLNRKQRETRRGRAELKLEERAVAWYAKRETKQLPTLLEWLNISWLTSVRQWSQSQRLMMRVATRLHLTRIGFAAIVLITLSTLVPVLIQNQREAKRLLELRQKVIAIEDEIQSLPIDDLCRPSIITRLTQLQEQDPQSYARLSKMHDRHQFQLLDEVLKRPRLSIEEVERLSEWVKLVRNPTNRETLASRLEKRQASWNDVLNYSSPFANITKLPEVIGANSGTLISIDSNSLKLQQDSTANAGVHVVTLPIESDAKEQITVEFDENWSDSKKIGVFLDGNVDAEERFQGWEARLSIGKSKATGRVDASSFDAALKSRAPLVLQLFHSRLAMVTQDIDPTEVVGKPLRFRLQRVGDEFQIQINQLPELRFDECFSKRSEGKGSPGLLWPSKVTVKSIFLERSTAAASAQPLDEADELYRQGKFEDALNLYLSLSTDRVANELNDECFFKIGLSYAKLKNKDAAARTFQELLEGSASKWSIRAACELLKIRLEGRDHDDAKGVVQVLRAKFRPEEVSRFVSIDRRNEIADLLYTQNVQANWVQRKDQTERTRFVAEAFDAINCPLSQKIEVWSNLFFAKSQIANVNETLAEAREFATSVLKNPTANQDDILKVVETCQFIAMYSGIREGGDELLEQAEASMSAIAESNPYGLRKLRAQWCCFLKRYTEALEFCQLAKTTWRGSSPDYDAEHLLGWIQHAMGDEAQAIQTWRKAFQQHKAEECTMLSVAILGSLSDEITQATADQMFATVAEKFNGELAINFLKPYVPMHLIHQGARYMWQTEYGREMARRIGTAQCSYREHLTGQLSVATFYFLKSMTLDDPKVFELTPREFDQGIRNSCESIRIGYEDGRLSQQDFLKLGIAYLGNVGVFGFNGFVANKNFTVQEKATICYCLGCHFERQKNRLADAKSAFKIGATSSDPVIAKLSAEKLDALEK